ncbi:MAG: substrate binding domain-containing protein, partial [Kangiellaceae bacterium]|nr:substrate binding domain-containing protein [Kangiellaceae bacterium]
VRYGSPNDASLYGFKICDIPVLLCASPDYLVRKGTPKHPSDLASHNGLFYQLNDVTHDVWTFSGADRDKAKYKIKMKGNRLSNDGDLVRRWCVAGRGIAVKSCLDMSNDLLSGKVVNVMPEYKARSTELWLVCPSRQLITPAVRLLRDAFREKSVEIMKKLENHGVFEDKVC